MHPLMIAHTALMALALLLVISAVVTAHNRKEGWFPLHRKLALIGVGCALCAFACIAGLKIIFNKPHLSSLHAIAGAVSLLFLVVTPVLGMLVVRGKEGLRAVHRVLGRITFAAVVLTVAMGIGRLIQIFKR